MNRIFEAGNKVMGLGLMSRKIVAGTIDKVVTCEGRGNHLYYVVSGKDWGCGGILDSSAAMQFDDTVFTKAVICEYEIEQLHERIEKLITKKEDE